MEAQEIIDIAIIDDDKLFAHAMKANIENYFSSEKIRIKLYEIGELFFENLEINVPHIVLLDINLDSKYHDAVSGMTILEKIGESGANTNVIMVTSEIKTSTAIKAFRFGAKDFVVKNENVYQQVNENLDRIRPTLFKKEKFNLRQLLAKTANLF